MRHIRNLPITPSPSTTSRSRVGPLKIIRWNFEMFGNDIQLSPITLAQIAEFAGGSLTGNGRSQDHFPGQHRLAHLQRGDLFVALRGENFDGHRFVDNAAKRGAVGAMVERNWPETFQRLCDHSRCRHARRISKNRGEISKITAAQSRSPSREATARRAPRIFSLRRSAGDFASQKPKGISTITSAFRARCWRQPPRMKSPFGKSG